MNGWLLDTDVISEARKLACDAGVETFLRAQPESILFLSVVTPAEIRIGIDRAKNNLRKQELSRWLTNDLRQRFAGRILSPDEETLFVWIELMRTHRAAGTTLAQPDALIAATAKVHDMCIVTRNSSDFVGAGIPVFNPWTNVLEMPGRKPSKMNGVMTLDRVR